jgi:DNA polymerase
MNQLNLGLELPASKKEDVVQTIKRYTGKCRDCALGYKFPNNYGFVWRGNPKASLAWIGIMPADKEWETGRAMMGEGGNLLNKWCSFLGINADKDSFIGNVLQCITPRVKKDPKEPGKGEFRPPDKEELAVCFPRCLNVLRAMPNLKVVVLLGAVAQEQFAGADNPYGQGDWFTNDRLLPGVLFYCMPHPAFVLRSDHPIYQWSEEKFGNAERLLGYLKAVLDKLKKGEPL